MAKRARPEQDLHLAVAAYLRVALRPPTIWTTIPVGGGGRVRGAILKGMGVQAGWPDILVMAPGPKIVGIELKSKSGRFSREQSDMSVAFYHCKAVHVLCRSVEEVENCLRFCKVPMFASVSGTAVTA